jgi:hypothetical protein
VVTDPTYSGDVTLAGECDAPAALVDPADVFVASKGVRDGLVLRNVEYVFAGPSIDGNVDAGTPATRYAGDVEDGYLTDVRGRAIVTDAEDVFIAHGATGGGIDVDGAEQVFHDGRTPDRSPQSGDATVTGWRQSRSLGDPPTGVRLAGIGHEVTITDPPGSLTLYLTGYDHSVRIEGGPAAVTVHVVGRDNRVSTGPYVDASIATESGHENVVESDPVPIEDVIETSEAAAFDSVTIGRARVTYQIPATDEEWCPNCGADADAIVERHYRDALFLFGVPVYTFEAGGDSYNCEACATLPPDARLSEAERRNLLR